MSAVQPFSFIAFSEWLSLDRKLSPHTVRAYQTDLRSLLQFLAQHWDCDHVEQNLANVSIADLRAWLADRHQRQECSPRSNARALATVRSVANFCEKHCGFTLTAATMIKGPRLPVLLPRPLEESSVRAVLAFPGTEDTSTPPWMIARDRAILMLLYGAGLRLGEALALPGDLTIGESLRFIGKRQKERIVPLLPIVQEHLRAYRQLCPFSLTSDTKFFRGARGNTLNPGHIQKLLRHMRAQLGLPETATPHALRHSFASHILETCDDLRSLQELLGHASLVTTQNYAKVTNTKLRRTYAQAHPRQRKK